MYTAAVDTAWPTTAVLVSTSALQHYCTTHSLLRDELLYCTRTTVAASAGMMCDNYCVCMRVLHCVSTAMKKQA
jgi:hypothetical protein